ncbi:MAG: N-acetyltransferase [Chloroflexota bacterium]
MTGSDIRVRARELGDLEAIVELMGCPRVVRNTLQVPFTGADVRREQFNAQRPGLYPLVAELGGKVVGELVIDARQRPRRRHTATFGMAIHDAFAGRGVGSALVTAMLELAERWLEILRIELTVYADNAPAIGLYTKFGFVTEGTLRHYAFRDGVYVDALSMARCRVGAERPTLS